MTPASLQTGQIRQSPLFVRKSVLSVSMWVVTVCKYVSVSGLHPGQVASCAHVHPDAVFLSMPTGAGAGT